MTYLLLQLCFLLSLSLALSFTPSSPPPPVSSSNARRSLLTAPFVAVPFLLLPKNALAADKPASIFEGTYSDPNHPGGTRTVTLSPDSPSVGRYRLATVTGGGGTGEPASFTLPAMLQGDNKIVVDFSAKGGPKVSNSSSCRLLFR